MTHEYQLELMIQDTGEKVLLSGRFEDEEWKRLEEFIQYADNLLHTTLIQENEAHPSLNIRWDKDSATMTVSTKLPRWDLVEVFLHRFRPIGLQSESTYFFRICNILAKELAHPYFRRMIQEQREVYNGKKMRDQLQIRSNDVVLNSEKVLSDWLNSYEYHRDGDKRKFIDSLHVMLPLEASKALFLMLLFNKTDAIHNIAMLTRLVLGKQKHLTCNVPVDK